MSSKTILVLGLLIVACLAVILLSSYATNQLAAAPGPFRGREPFGLPGGWPLSRVGPFGRHLFDWRGIASALASFSFLYLVSVLWLFVFPRRLRVARDALGRGAGEVLRLFGIGAIGAVALLSLTVLGTFAFVAFPVSILLLAVLLLAIWVGAVALALALGRGINRWAGLERSSPVFDLVLGTLVIFAFGRIPIAGWVIVALLGALALGVVIATRFGAGGPWSLADFDAGEEVPHA